MSKETTTKGNKFVGGNQNPQTESPNDPHGLGHLWKALKALEDYFAPGAVLIATVGYIIIASFGEMRVREYTVFIATVFSIYALILILKKITSGIKKIFGESTSDNFFILGFFVLLLILIISNFDLLRQYFFDFLDLLNITDFEQSANSA